MALLIWEGRINWIVFSLANDVGRRVIRNHTKKCILLHIMLQKEQNMLLCTVGAITLVFFEIFVSNYCWPSDKYAWWMYLHVMNCNIRFQKILFRSPSSHAPCCSMLTNCNCKLQSHKKWRACNIMTKKRDEVEKRE